MGYTQNFTYLVEQERQAEIKRHEEEIGRLSGAERKKLGRCEFPLKGHKSGRIFHYIVVQFFSENPINTKISVGDLVLISRGDPRSSDLTGTVTEVGKMYIAVAFDSPPPKWVFRQGIRIDLYANDVTYKRMQENLQLFFSQKHPLKSLILSEQDPYPTKPVKFEPLNKDLNKSQRNAVANALGTRDIFVIQGPPGTGKTTTLTEIIVQAVDRRKRVLVTAESNTATDNLLMQLDNYEGLNIVRIGQPARIVKGYENYSLYAQFQKHPEGQKISAKWDEVKQDRARQKKYKKPTQSVRRGLTDGDIISHVKKGKTPRGLKRRELCSMYEWIKLQNSASDKVNLIKELEQQIFEEIIENADIVITTNSMTASQVMQNVYFDLAVIDEGSQQIEPSTLIPILKAKRVIIAGDHKQLPPTIISQEARALEETFFERFIQDQPEASVLLDTQYRMHQDILAFPKQRFYKGKLQSAPTVAQQKMSTLFHKNTLLPFPLNKQYQSDFFQNMISDTYPVVFLDTEDKKLNKLFDQKMNHWESMNPRSKSYENEYESALVDFIARGLLQKGITKKMIGVITPYRGQVHLIQKKLEDTDIEVNSVDGFQGREKEVIILSLVRANEENRIGFLQDLRRLNVAITRAKKKLIIIGHKPTITSHKDYENWWRFYER